MLSSVNFNNVEIVGKGSVYYVDKEKKKKGLAFYYIVNGDKKIRKVVTASSDEELLEKATAFLDKLDKECEEKKKIAGSLMITSKSELTDFVYEEETVPVKMTFKEVADEWYKEYSAPKDDKKKPLSFSTVESRFYSLKRINKYIGDISISEITQEIAEDLIDDCSIKDDGTYYSESSVSKDWQAFGMVMEYGRKKGYCNQVLEKVVLSDKLGKVDTDKRFLDREQLNQVMRVVNENPRYRIIIKLLIATGLRQEEAFALHVDDFKVKKGGIVEIAINKTNVEVKKNQYDIVKRTKTDRSKRKVYIPYDLYEELMEYYNNVLEEETLLDVYARHENGTEGLIFVNKDKKILNKRTFINNLKRYLNGEGEGKRKLVKRERLGFKVTLHMLRHSFASFQAESRPALEVAKLLGDTVKTIEDNYYSMSENTIAEVTDNTSEIMRSIERYGKIDEK